MRAQASGDQATNDVGDDDSFTRGTADGVKAARGLPRGFSLTAPAWLPRLTLAAVIAVGIGLRFVTTSNLWLDEALSVNIATLPVGDLLEALRHDGHPPFYYLLLRGWTELVGEGDMAVRSLSGIFAVAALPLAWVAGRRRAGVTGARWAVVIVALSPYAVRYATEARMYSLIMLLVLAGYLLIDDALLRPARWRLAAIAAVSGLLLLSHYWAFYLLAALIFVMAWRWWRRAGERRSIGPVLVAVATGGLLFLPWLPSFWYQATHTGTPWAEPTRPLAIVQRTLGDLGGGDNLPEAIIYGSVLLILCLLAVFVARSQDHGLVVDLRTVPTVRRELDVVVLTVAVGTVGGYATSSTFESRYAAVLVPLVLLAAAVGLSRLPRAPRLVVGSAVVVLSLPGLVWVQHFERTQAPVIGAAIARTAQPGDVVIYCPDQLGPAYSRATPDGLVELAYPTLGTPERVDWVDYADRNAQADPAAVGHDVRALAAGHAIFVVWKGDYATFGAQCETLVDTLGADSHTDRLVIQDGSRYYEPANLFRIAPDAPG
jgi:mannosyltransferase